MATEMNWAARVRQIDDWGWANEPPMSLMQQRMLLFNLAGIISWVGPNAEDFSNWEGKRLRDDMAKQGYEFRTFADEDRAGVQVLFVRHINGDSVLIPREAPPLTVLLAQYKAAISAVRAHHSLQDKGLV